MIDRSQQAAEVVEKRRSTTLQLLARLVDRQPDLVPFLSDLLYYHYDHEQFLWCVCVRVSLQQGRPRETTHELSNPGPDGWMDGDGMGHTNRNEGCACACPGSIDEWALRLLGQGVRADNC